MFFPSYVVLQSCLEAWKVVTGAGGSVWGRICNHKQPVVEPRVRTLAKQQTLGFSRICLNMSRAFESQLCIVRPGQRVWCQGHRLQQVF